jgi:hypothetical protein
MSKASVIQVSGVVSFTFKCKGLCPKEIITCCVSIKIEFLCAGQNKPCVVNIIMLLIPWKHLHGGETLFALKSSVSVLQQMTDYPLHINNSVSAVFL